jgi:hypothetical protein
MVKVPPPPVLVVRPQHSARRWRWWLLGALVWLASLALALALQHETGDLGLRAELAGAKQESETLRKRIAVLERSEQVARAAYTDLQQSLRDRQEEIAALRADLAFYSRLTNAGKLEGLNVHGVHLKPGSAPRVYNFTVTLTQTLKSGQIASGRVRLGINGVRGGKLTALAWSELAPNQDGAGVPFAFKYFQQVSGTLMLPEGFTPNRIRVEADASGDMGRAEQEFAWADALAEPGTDTTEVSDVQN